MLLPVYAYGHPVLKKKGENIDDTYTDLEILITDMWDTMYYANGVGLAAPQIGKSIRLFLVDSTQMMEKGHESEGIKQVFINAEILEESGEEWPFEEGCLSIPEIRGDVMRKPKIKIKFQDENFIWHENEYEGITARVIQHEYDHIEGILFTELLKPLKKKRLFKKLENIKKGKIKPSYKMKFAAS